MYARVSWLLKKRDAAALLTMQWAWAVCVRVRACVCVISRQQYGVLSRCALDSDLSPGNLRPSVCYWNDAVNHTHSFCSWSKIYRHTHISARRVNTAWHRSHTCPIFLHSHLYLQSPSIYSRISLINIPLFLASLPKSLIQSTVVNIYIKHHAFGWAYFRLSTTNYVYPDAFKEVEDEGAFTCGVIRKLNQEDKQ